MADKWLKKEADEHPTDKVEKRIAEIDNSISRLLMDIEDPDAPGLGDPNLYDELLDELNQARDCLIRAIAKTKELKET
jgi:hypothetical protein